MQRILILFFIVLSSSLNLYAQEKDSLSQVQELKSVDIIAYFSKQPILELTSAGESISTNLIETQQNTSLLPSLNTVSGLRMEERSPGSYRLAMRGSLIRSPFGVRNIKIYLDEFVLTDAGGNTYLNLIDPASLSSVNILKGPDGSLYGANSGCNLMVLASIKTKLPYKSVVVHTVYFKNKFLYNAKLMMSTVFLLISH
ncbi:TonB-dependent receptor plug domain-containing protein [Psychroflexus halocasei]|uniref:Iron complex outermembrane recepter protein n=1 Tax=Psychroflexus halocasei TaxID=908615 RepID=A0A1H4B306_9FLAO|nr:Plug domain-containing protein [Psychroflexus halocasei]SEA42530.1 iron complex outermembrane recepter protein [Psychroflexus halocasei]